MKKYSPARDIRRLQSPLSTSVPELESLASFVRSARVSLWPGSPLPSQPQATGQKLVTGRKRRFAVPLIVSATPVHNASPTGPPSATAAHPSSAMRCDRATMSGASNVRMLNKVCKPCTYAVKPGSCTVSFRTRSAHLALWSAYLYLLSQDTGHPKEGSTRSRPVPSDAQPHVTGHHCRARMPGRSGCQHSGRTSAHESTLALPFWT
mmetsp:Transcript_75799/g.232017  ORF Transcript_75799/g.232017 Transcript_75799/m.232017 type:complete len:207 (+) Transcript_75799:345-965(+)